MSVVITGGAGFIGVNLAAKFVNEGDNVFIIDNLCRGSIKNINLLNIGDRVNFKYVNLNNYSEVLTIMDEINRVEKISEVWHMAANSDIPAGVENADIDLSDTFMTTFNVLKAMKEVGTKFFAFASTSAVYGDLGMIPLTEDIGPLLPISNYGAMKLASEACVSAAVENFIDKGIIFRFPNVIGIPATHGVIYDFINKLNTNSCVLEVLGNGTQQKSYLHVDDLIDAMFHIKRISIHGVNIFNIGPDDDGVSVKFIAEEVVRQFQPTATISYGVGNKGWVGDVPKFIYSTDKVRRSGWSSKLSSEKAVKKAISQIIMQQNKMVFQ
jgi:UDP-glucose 4-epimerase